MYMYILIFLQISSIHRHLGVCPQFDIQYPDLTCEEHLLFYARLKGAKIGKAGKIVKTALEKVSKRVQNALQVHCTCTYICCTCTCTAVLVYWSTHCACITIYMYNQKLLCGKLFIFKFLRDFIFAKTEHAQYKIHLLWKLHVAFFYLHKNIVLYGITHLLHPVHVLL